MEQGLSWEANQSAASQGIPRILWNPKVHCRIHKCPPPVPILRSSIQSIRPHPTSWRTILILSSHLRLGLPSGLFPSGFPTKTLYTPLLSPIRATCPAQCTIRYPSSDGAVGGYAARTGQTSSAFLLGRATCVFFFGCIPIGSGEFTVMPDSEIYSTDCYRSLWRANNTFNIINGVNQTDMWSEWQIGNFARHCTEQILQ